MFNIVLCWRDGECKHYRIIEERGDKLEIEATDGSGRITVNRSEVADLVPKRINRGRSRRGNR